MTLQRRAWIASLFALLASQSVAPSDDHRTAVTIRALSGLTGKPLAGAEVRWVSADEDELPSEPRALLAGATEVARSGPDGLATFTIDRGYLVVEARHGADFGADDFYANVYWQGAHDLLLWPDFDVTATVVDATGRPVADVPVTIWEDGSSRFRRVVQSSGADGSVVFRHVGSQLRDLRASRALEVQGEADWRVGLDFCGARAVGIAIDVAAPPKQPIVFTLPATGSVVVEASDVDGRSVALIGTGLLSIFSSEGLSWSVLNHLRKEPHSQPMLPATVWRGRNEGGRLLFPFVGLDAHLMAYAQRNGASEPCRTDGDGPKRAGEQVTLHLVLGSEGRVVRGRALDAAGRPLADRDLLVESALRWHKTPNVAHIGPEVTYSALGQLRTDAEGGFTLDLAAQEPTVHETPFLVLASNRNRPDALEAVAPLPTTSELATDLGDVVLASAPVIAEGVVVDEARRPVAGARIDGPSWKASGPRLRTTTDDSGRFMLRGAILEAGGNLSVEAPRRPKYQGILVSGSRDLRIFLPRESLVRGRIQVPAGSSGEAFSISLKPAGTKLEGAPDEISMGVSADGSFRLVRLWPGDWEFRLRGPSHDGRAILKSVTLHLSAGQTLDLGLLTVE